MKIDRKKYEENLENQGKYEDKMFELQIYTPDDSRRFHTTNIGFLGEVKSDIGYRYRSAYYDSNTITPNASRNTHEPTIEAIKGWLTRKLGINRKGSGEFQVYILLGDKKNPNMILFNKIGTRFHVNGFMQSKDVLLVALARTIYRSCFTKDSDTLNKYLFNHIKLPENVSYALENRAPFHWYIKGKRIDVRFNVKMISEDECAMEISDGVWAPISVKNLNIYMNFYWKEQARGKWKHLSPNKLWVKLLKKEPTEAQQALMIGFLEQNRTDDMVEDRAIELVKGLEEQFGNKIRVFWYERGADTKERVKAILVRGRMADWVITDNQYKSEIQAVSTYIYSTHVDDKNGRALTIPNKKYGNGKFNGPICIDNMTKHSSIGDQFAARTLALINDEMTIAIVSTISRYLNSQHYVGQEIQRLVFENVGDEDIHKIFDNKNNV